MVGYPPSYAVRSARSVHDMARLGDLSPPTPSFEGLASHEEVFGVNSPERVGECTRSDSDSPEELDVGDCVEIDGVEYIIEKSVGSGSFGTVWEARCGDRRVAIKATDKSGAKEAEAMQAWKGCAADARLSELIAFDRRRNLLVLNLVEDSVALDDWLRRVDLGQQVDTVEDVISVCTRLLAQMARALEVTSKYIIHRDVCSHNILVNVKTGDFTLIDFGLCSQRRTFSARQGLAGDCRYWPVCEWLLFLRGHRYVENCPEMLRDYLRRLDHHALALTVIEVLSKLYRRLGRSSVSESCTGKGVSWQSGDFSTALFSSTDGSHDNSSLPSARSPKEEEPSEVIGLDSPPRSEVGRSGAICAIEGVVAAFEKYWEEVMPFWRDLLETFKEEGNWGVLQRRLDAQRAPIRVHEALCLLKRSILESIGICDTSPEVQSLFKALLGLLLCASSPPIRQMSFREVIQTLEGKLALPPTVVQASVAPLGIPLPLLTHVPSHMRLWTVDNSVSLARNLTPVKMLGRRHRDHHHHHRHYHFPVGSLHAATPVVDQRCYVGTAVPERLTFNGSS